MIDPSKREIRVGIAGAGYWGPNLIRVCADLGVLDSVCDSNQAALAKIAQQYPSVATTDQWSALLARPIDAAVIATPAQLHADMALQAIAAGKHVFVEKPLALELEQARQIERSAKQSGLLVFVGHLLLYHPAVKKLRALIAQGVIGDIWHVRSRRLSLGKLRSHENVWWSFAPHDVALMVAIFGDAPLSVSAAQSYGRGVPISDVCYADFEFSNGRSGHIEVCWLDPEKTARLDVFGTRGVLTLVDSRRGSSLALKPFAVAQDEHAAPIVVSGVQQDIDTHGPEPLRAELRAFMDSLTTGAPSESDARHGVAVVKALSMAEEAAKQRAQVGVPA